MNIQELDAFNLADAVKFHDHLNPRLWDQREHLRPEVHSKLMEIARDFQEFLGVDNIEVKDITISGSNAAYNYTPHSDVDLHLIVDMPQARESEVFRELFDAKKFQYNTEHDIRIGGYDVELYVQDSEQPHHSQGIYSLLQNRWLSVPKRRKPEVDDISVKSKYEDVGHRIEAAILSGDQSRMDDVWHKLKTMRSQGLEREGEFSPENIAFKMLRNNGTIGKLKQARQAVRDRELSLAEKAKPRQRVTYGFAESYKSYFKTPEKPVEPPKEKVFRNPKEYEWYKLQQDPKKQQTKESPDGVNPSTKMFLESDIEDVISKFFVKTTKFLNIQDPPKIVFHHDTDWSEGTGSFGQYDPDDNLLHLATSGRHTLDVLRTMAHELTHCKQNEKDRLPPNAGETGSWWEDEANAMAGRIMRYWAEEHPDMFGEVPLEESSGYIPTKREKNDPRFKTALTVDVQPGETGRQANKMALNTDAQGRPALLMKSANLREGRMPQPSQGQGRYRDLNEPLGPETPPTMPAGTVKVDVSDVYDWYKLGQHISNMKGLGKHDFGAGPPSAIISFGDEETEHKYIKDLEKTGLTTTDIDPVDPNQPKDMPRQKTDPTYNVDEDLVESLRREFELLENEVLGEISMRPSSLRQEAAKTGALAGMEFEMIVPNVAGGEIEPEWERDNDMDRRARSFDDIERFFNDGDHNGRGDIRRLMERLQEDYQEWKMERTADDWAEQGEDYVRDYIVNNNLFDRDEAMQEARDELIEANPELATDSEDFQQLLSARVQEMEDEFVVSEFEGQGRIYSDAFEEFADEVSEAYEESDWLDENTPYMSDVESSYDITWPYWYDINAESSGDTDIDAIAADFSEAIGRPVNASQRYSMGAREPGKYVVEPDGSLDPDNSNEAGLEFVSPPLPIDEILSDLNKVREWAGRVGAYTNSSTGLHINISVPNFDPAKLDYVKLALLLGDKYVLEQFGRSSNTYTESALGKVEKAVRENPQTARALLDKMRGHMGELATKAIHSGETKKYTSINTKNNRIEFRSPGGDWLDENFDKVENTLLRFTVALSAAMDPEAYREEYLKKLYKLLDPQGGESRGPTGRGGKETIRYFADYVAGNLPQAALRSFVKQAQLERQLKKGETGGQKFWWEVSNPRYSFGTIEVVASTEQEAIEKALGPDGYPSWANTRNTVTAKPLRPYEEKPQKQGTTVAGRPNNPDGNWYLKNADTDEIFYRFNAANYQDAHTVLQQWKQENPNSNVNAVYGQGRDEPAQPQAQEQVWYVSPRDNPGREVQVRATSELAALQAAAQMRPDIFGDVAGRSHLFRAALTGAGQASQQAPRPLGAGRELVGWSVRLADGREVTQIHGIGNSQADANRIAAQWLRNNGYGVSGEGYEVVPLWREA